MTCGEIVSMRGVTPATVSHHLKILKGARLIACRRKGQFVYSQACARNHRILRAGAREDRARQKSSTSSLTLANRSVDFLETANHSRFLGEPELGS